MIRVLHFTEKNVYVITCMKRKKNMGTNIYMSVSILPLSLIKSNTWIVLFHLDCKCLHWLSWMTFYIPPPEGPQLFSLVTFFFFFSCINYYVWSITQFYQQALLDIQFLIFLIFKTKKKRKKEKMFECLCSIPFNAVYTSSGHQMHT